MPRELRDNRRVREQGDLPAPPYTLKSLPADERPRERLLLGGPRALSDAELLAIILRTGLVGETVTEMSRDLLAQFGGYWGLASATVEQLARRPGLKAAKIAQIKAAIEIGRRMAESAVEQRALVSSPADAARLVQFEMAALEQEEMRVVLLDTKNRVLGRPRVVYRGTLNSTTVRVAELFRDAVRESAASIVLLHNHPSGDPTPSPEDVHVTRLARDAGKLLDVELLDHVVIGRRSAADHDGWVSLKQRGLGFG